MSEELQDARNRAVTAIADWLAIYGDEVGAEASRLEGSPLDAIRFVLEAGQAAVLDARTIVSEGFDQASQVVEAQIEAKLAQPSEADIDAEVARLASDPDTWVIEDDHPSQNGEGVE